MNFKQITHKQYGPMCFFIPDNDQPFHYQESYSVDGVHFGFLIDKDQADALKQHTRKLRQERDVVSIKKYYTNDIIKE